jgi:hypothetical protein
LRRKKNRTYRRQSLHRLFGVGQPFRSVLRADERRKEMNVRYLPIRQVLPPHEYLDERKVDYILRSMRRNGWRGDPLVVVPYADAYAALNGSHRLAAAWRLYEELSAEDEIEEGLLPMAEIVEDVFPGCIPAVVIDEERFYSLADEIGSDNPFDILNTSNVIVAEYLDRIGERDAAAVIRRERN